MAKKKITQEVQERIDSMLKARDDELAEIVALKNEAVNKCNEAEQQMEVAAKNTDIDAYSMARKNKDDAKCLADMYNSKHEQLINKGIVSDEESNRVINSLLEYERDLANKYLDDILDSVQKLEKVHREYLAEVEETEMVMNEWTRKVHANYINLSSGYALGDGTYTNVYDTPQPVHEHYKGCDVSKTISLMLNNDYVQQILSGRAAREQSNAIEEKIVTRRNRIIAKQMG